jgi:hypothetical protein
MPQLRRSYGNVSTTATGVLYLLCFRERLGTDKHSIKHYLGFAWDLDARLEKHRAGQGARITQVLLERGIAWDVVAVWPGNRGVENELKLHSATRICPRCTPGAQPPRIVQEVVKAEAQRRAREARKAARQIRERQRHAAAIATRAAMSPYEPGADTAQQWIRQQTQARRTAEQIAATDAHITHAARGRENALRLLSIWRGACADDIEQAAADWQTPYYEGHRTPEGDAEHGAFAEVVTAELDRLREKQAAAAQQPQPLAGQIESEAGPFPARNPTSAEPVPEDDASWLAGPDDDHTWEADADGYPEPGSWASEPPVELDAGTEE